MKNYLNVLKGHLFELAFVLMLFRVLILGTAIPESIVFLGLMAAMSFQKHLDKAKETKESVTEQEIKDMKRAIETVQFVAGIKKNDSKK